MKTMSAEEYRKLTRPKSKYRNKKTEIEGHIFDSKAEADRYVELRHLEMAYEIRGFGIQPSFVLSDGIRYRPDFIVCGQDGSVWVEDVKGYKTKEFKLKQKLWEREYPWLPLVIIR